MNNSTAFEIAHGQHIVILPLGAWEQHGPHLPLHTDSLIVEAVVASALSHIPNSEDSFVVAPTMSITASDEHAGFAGGLSCGTQALVDSVVAIARSASWARGVCVVNGHGGNMDALKKIASALEYEKIRATQWSLPSYKGGDMHAGHTETSLLLHLHPALVRHDKIEAGAVDITTRDIDTMRTDGVRAVSPNGVLGNPMTASAQHGEHVLNMYAESLLHTLHQCLDTWS